MKKLSALFIAGSMLMGNMGSVMAEDDGGILAAGNFSATMTFTSDYVFRGTTFSDEDPALQGSFDWGYGAWFAGAWGSSTNATDGNGLGGTLEIDYYAGWADSVGGFDLMVMPLVYTFPGQEDSDPRDDFTFELWTSIGRGIGNFPGAPYVNLEFNYSPEFFDGGDDAYYIRPSIAFTLPGDFGLDIGYGYQDVGGVASATNKGNEFFADDYSHVDVGLTKSALGFDFDLRYHDNFDEDVIGAEFASESQIQISVSRSF